VLWKAYLDFGKEPEKEDQILGTERPVSGENPSGTVTGTGNGMSPDGREID
jgi:hypothetical protein